MKIGKLAGILCATALLCGTLGSSTAAAEADNYPDQLIRVIVPYPAGGATDTLGRILAEEFTKSWGQTAIVENRPGASGMLGGEQVARSTPDGHTILVGITAMVQVPHLYDNVPYDVNKDFIPVAELARSGNLFVVPSSVPANTLGEFVELVKANPGKYNYGSYGTATSAHIHGEILNAQAGIDLLHVPYRGSAPLITDVLGGQVTSAFLDIASIRAHLDSGRFKVLASTGAERFEILPDVPTFTESGYGDFEPYGFFAIFVPAGTPDGVVAKLSAEVERIVHSPEVKARIGGLGLQPVGIGTEAFSKTIANDYEIWGRVIKEAGVTAN